MPVIPLVKWKTVMEMGDLIKYDLRYAQYSSENIYTEDVVKQLNVRLKMTGNDNVYFSILKW